MNYASGHARHQGYTDLALIVGSLLSGFLLFRSPWLYLPMPQKSVLKVGRRVEKNFYWGFFFRPNTIYATSYICCLHMLTSVLNQALSLIINNMAQYDYNILHLHPPFLSSHSAAPIINNHSDHGNSNCQV